jgi:hypothetical protein
VACHSKNFLIISQLEERAIASMACTSPFQLSLSLDAGIVMQTYCSYNMHPWIHLYWYSCRQSSGYILKYLCSESEFDIGLRSGENV